MPNTGRVVETGPLGRDLPKAVEQVRAHVRALRGAYERGAAARLRPAVRTLRHWRSASKDRLARLQESTREGHARHRRIEQERAEIDRIYAARHRWIDQAVRVVAAPYVRLAAVLVRS